MGWLCSEPKYGLNYLKNGKQFISDFEQTEQVLLTIKNKTNTIFTRILKYPTCTWLHHFGIRFKRLKITKRE